MESNIFSKKIISWYEEHKRLLPWRASKDPYKIWLSEITLQQTRVNQGLPYYKEFINRYPTVEKLAGATEKDVLKTWEGLGYYTRARNLHKCAKKIVKEYNGKFPRTYESLLVLPGIGTYTAAAIASMAFDEPKAVLDGNVYRVLARLYGVDNDINSGEGKRVFTEMANRLIDTNSPGAFNQALMEFGALCCVPKSPNCKTCIFRKSCFANRHSLQDSLPHKGRKVKVTKRYMTYFVLEYRGKWAMRSRRTKDIWRGLSDFYLVESKRITKPDNVFLKDKALKLIMSQLQVKAISKPMVYKLTHQRIIAQFVEVNVISLRAIRAFLKREGLKFYDAGAIADLPKPVLISRFLAKSEILA